MENTSLSEYYFRPNKVFFLRDTPYIEWELSEDASSQRPLWFDELYALALPGLRTNNKFCTSLPSLLPLLNCLQVPDPAAIIFHVSRCGSTLLSKLLSDGAGLPVLREPNFLNKQFFTAADRPLSEFVLLMQCLCLPYYPSPAVIKTGSFWLLQTRLIAQAFPDVKKILLFRDPSEVIVSNMDLPGLFYYPENYEAFKTYFPAYEDDQQLTGRIINLTTAKYQSACDMQSEFDICIDYPDLQQRFYDILSMLGLSADHADTYWQQVAQVHSKKPSAVFEDDRERKQQQAATLLKDYDMQRLEQFYIQLLEASSS